MPALRGKKCWFYVIECKDRSLYTGVTNDLSRRLSEHISGVGGARYTKVHGVKRILYCSECPSKSEAMRAEKKFKTFSKEKKLSIIRKLDSVSISISEYIL